MLEDFHGNARVVRSLEGMIEQSRVPQTLLLAGPGGIGKATLARRFAARLLGDRAKIEKDDLSLQENVMLIEEREKWTSDQRSEDPLFFGSHPDFLTFPPDGPLRQISIQQMRLLKERAPFKPLHGDRRVFLIDQIDRAGEQAANSLLKTLEEPPDHLILILTAENSYDLLPTIRSRSVILHLSRLSREEMSAFVAARGLDNPERRIALSGGSPGRTISIDLEDYDRRRRAMLTLLQVACGSAPFSDWLPYSDGIAATRQDKLDTYLKVLYGLLADVLQLQHGTGEIGNADIQDELKALARRISFEWMRTAVARVDELIRLLRRNIQRAIALDALILELRAEPSRFGT